MCVPSRQWNGHCLNIELRCKTPAAQYTLLLFSGYIIIIIWPAERPLLGTGLPIDHQLPWLKAISIRHEPLTRSSVHLDGGRPMIYQSTVSIRKLLQLQWPSYCHFNELICVGSFGNPSFSTYFLIPDSILSRNSKKCFPTTRWWQELQANNV